MKMSGKYLAVLALVPACGFAQVSPSAQADITVGAKIGTDYQ
jgi:hypothetical protein